MENPGNPRTRFVNETKPDPRSKHKDIGHRHAQTSSKSESGARSRSGLNELNLDTCFSNILPVVEGKGLGLSIIDDCLYFGGFFGRFSVRGPSIPVGAPESAVSPRSRLT